MSIDLVSVYRQNHALEHATITLLINKLGLSQKLMGMAARDGFYIFGDVPSDEVREAAAEALARLQSGERDLAVSPFCGTNIVVAGALAALACLVAFGGEDRRSRLPLAMLMATGAIIAARPVGRVVQKYVTTSPNLADVTIKRITRRGVGSRILHKVETSRDVLP